MTTRAEARDRTVSVALAQLNRHDIPATERRDNTVAILTAHQAVEDADRARLLAAAVEAAAAQFEAQP